MREHQDINNMRIASGHVCDHINPMSTIGFIPELSDIWWKSFAMPKFPSIKSNLTEKMKGIVLIVQGLHLIRSNVRLLVTMLGSAEITSSIRWEYKDQILNLDHGSKILPSANQMPTE